MSLSIAVIFPRPIVIAMGTLIEVIGAFADRDRVLGYQIIDAQQGINYSARPEDFGEAELYVGQTDFELPLIGRVVYSLQRDQATVISMYPTGHSPYDYNEIAGEWARAAVPTYWKIIDEKQAWASAIQPLKSGYFRKKEYRPERLDARGVVGLLQGAFGERESFNIHRAAAALWGSSNKLCQVERHRERLKVIDSLRLHLYQEMKSDAREFHLAETREEATLTAEAAIICIFSSLDILSHALAGIFNLGLSDREATFFNVAYRPGGDGEATSSARRCLERDFAGHPVTHLLLQHRMDWIQELSEWRHFIVHHGRLNNGEYVRGGVVLVKPKSNDEPVDSRVLPATATELVTTWSSKLRELLESTFTLLSEYAVTLTEAQEAEAKEEETLDPIALPNNASALDIVNSFLELWTRTDAVEPKRINHMFWRLSPDWRSEWGYVRFSKFVTDFPLHSFALEGTLSSSTNLQYGRMDSLAARLVFSDRKVRWHFTAVPYKDHRLILIRQPSSTIPSPVVRLQVTDYTSRQSGRETGHRDMVFSATVHNILDAQLEDVEAHIFWHDLSNAQTVVGSMKPGASQVFECSWKDACVPVGEFPSMWTERGRFRLWIIYRVVTEYGDWWAEDHGFA